MEKHRNNKTISKSQFLAFVGEGNPNKDGIVSEAKALKSLPPLPIDVPALPGIYVTVAHTRLSAKSLYLLLTDGFRPRPAVAAQLMKLLLDDGDLRMPPVIVAQGMGECIPYISDNRTLNSNCT